MRASARRVICTFKNNVARLQDSSAVYGSNIWRRGGSVSATVRSESSKPQGIRKRSKQERRATIISFVDKYRASNGGKLPSPTLVKKEVGGSFYPIRVILQEIEYSFKVLPQEKNADVSQQKPGKNSIQQLHEKESFQHLHVERFCADESPITETGSVSKRHAAEKEEPLFSRHVGQHSEDEFTEHVVSATRGSSNEQTLDVVEIPSISGHTSVDSHIEAEKDKTNGYQSYSSDGIAEFEGRSGALWGSNPSIMNGNSTQPSATSSESSVPGTGSARIQIDISSSKISNTNQADPVGTDSYGIELRKMAESLPNTNGKDENPPQVLPDHPVSDIAQRETSEESQQKDPKETRSTLWGNLKSLADGLFSFWRKM